MSTAAKPQRKAVAAKNLAKAARPKAAKTRNGPRRRKDIRRENVQINLRAPLVASHAVGAGKKRKREREKRKREREKSKPTTADTSV